MDFYISMNNWLTDYLCMLVVYICQPIFFLLINLEYHSSYGARRMQFKEHNTDSCRIYL
jgi:hypothetical protein